MAPCWFFGPLCGRKNKMRYDTGSIPQKQRCRCQTFPIRVGLMYRRIHLIQCRVRVLDASALYIDLSDHKWGHRRIFLFDLPVAFFFFSPVFGRSLLPFPLTSIQILFDLLHFIQTFPRKIDICSSEMSICRRLPVDRTFQIEFAYDRFWSFKSKTFSMTSVIFFSVTFRFQTYRPQWIPALPLR